MKTITLTIDRNDGSQEVHTSHLQSNDKKYIGEALVDLGNKLSASAVDGDVVLDIEYTDNNPGPLTRLLRRVMSSPTRYKDTTTNDRWNMFHFLWTACVGTEGYNKEQWQAVNKQLEMAEVICDNPNKGTEA